MDIVLVNPEIPQNVGGAARSAAAFNMRLILIGELPFDISEKAVRRAGLDYWQYVKLLQYKSWQDYVTQESPVPWFFSARGGMPLKAVNLSDGSALVFGSESQGLPSAMLAQHADRIVTIPVMNPNVRSLNLASSVAIAGYLANSKEV